MEMKMDGTTILELGAAHLRCWTAVLGSSPLANAAYSRKFELNEVNR